MKNSGLAQVVLYTCCWLQTGKQRSAASSVSVPSSDWCLCSKCPSTISTYNLSVPIRPPVYLCVTSSTIHLSFLPLCLNVSLSLSFCPQWFGLSFIFLPNLWSVSLRKVKEHSWWWRKVKSGWFVYETQAAVKDCGLSKTRQHTVGEIKTTLDKIKSSLNVLLFTDQSRLRALLI